MKADEVLKAIQNTKQQTRNVIKSLETIFESGHLPDNISILRTNASILKILADKLNKLRE